MGGIIQGSAFAVAIAGQLHGHAVRIEIFQTDIDTRIRNLFTGIDRQNQIVRQIASGNFRTDAFNAREADLIQLVFRPVIHGNPPFGNAVLIAERHRHRHVNGSSQPFEGIAQIVQAQDSPPFFIFGHRVPVFLCT